MLELLAVGCVAFNYDQLAAAIVTAAITATAVILAKHRPAGMRTRSTDQERVDAEVAVARAEEVAERARRRSRLNRALRELRRR